MTITPEKKREINNEIAKFLQHLSAESKERLSRVDVIDLKMFDINLNLSVNPQQLSISSR